MLERQNEWQATQWPRMLSIFHSVASWSIPREWINKMSSHKTPQLHSTSTMNKWTASSLPIATIGCLACHDMPLMIFLSRDRITWMTVKRPLLQNLAVSWDQNVQTWLTISGLGLVISWFVALDFEGRLISSCNTVLLLTRLTSHGHELEVWR